MPIKNSRHAQHFVSQPSFRRVVANLDGGGVPDKGEVHNANTIRSTWESAPVGEGSRSRVNGVNRDIGVGTDYMTAVLTVADNDFSTGASVIQIGDYELIAGVDFAIGALTGNTASNIAAAIQNNGLLGKGWRAIAVADDVTITYPHPGKIRFTVRHHGTAVNFTVSPTTGEMTYGGIQPGPPVLT